MNEYVTFEFAIIVYRIDRKLFFSCSQLLRVSILLKSCFSVVLLSEYFLNANLNLKRLIRLSIL